MKDENPISAEEIREMVKNSEIDVCKNLCCSVPSWNARSVDVEFSDKTDYICRHYLIASKNSVGYYCHYTDIRWDRIHGKKRKILKFEIKKRKRNILKQFDMWNKYAGKENVLYIHARIGGDNWNCFGGNELIEQPWFLDKVDDSYDETYCDIYASIK